MEAKLARRKGDQRKIEEVRTGGENGNVRRATDPPITVVAVVDPYLEGCFDIVLNVGEEAGKCIVAGDIEIPLFFDIVLVVLLADRVDPRQDVDHAHCFSLRLPPPTCVVPPRRGERC